MVDDPDRGSDINCSIIVGFTAFTLAFLEADGAYCARGEIDFRCQAVVVLGMADIK